MGRQPDVLAARRLAGALLVVQNRTTSLVHVLRIDHDREQAAWEVELAGPGLAPTDVLLSGPAAALQRSTGLARLAFIAGRRHLTIAEERRPGDWTRRDLRLPEPPPEGSFRGWAGAVAWAADGERLVCGGRWPRLFVVEGQATELTEVGRIASLARELTFVEGAEPVRIVCRANQTAIFGFEPRWLELLPLHEVGAVGPRERPGRPQVAFAGPTSAVVAQVTSAGIAPVSSAALGPVRPVVLEVPVPPDPDLDFSPDGRALYVTTPDRLSRFEVDDDGGLAGPSTLAEPGERSAFTSVVVTADGAWVVVGVTDEVHGPRVEVWPAPPRD